MSTEALMVRRQWIQARGADVLITPRGPGPGAVLELKVIDKDSGETPEQAAESALQQVQAKDYASEVKAAGANPVHVHGVVFDGKRCWVQPGNEGVSSS